MAEDPDSRLEQMEKAQHELLEQLIKAQEESMDQFNRYPQQGHEDQKDQNHESNFERTAYVGEIGSDEEIDESTITLELMRLVEMEDKQILPHQEVIEVIDLCNEEERKEVKIGTSLSPAIREEIINLLHEYVNIFAWSYKDVPGLSTEIVNYKLPLKPECKPVQQKLRGMKPNMLLKIKDEVKEAI